MPMQETDLRPPAMYVGIDDSERDGVIGRLTSALNVGMIALSIAHLNQLLQTEEFAADFSRLDMVVVDDALVDGNGDDVVRSLRRSNIRPYMVGLLNSSASVRRKGFHCFDALWYRRELDEFIENVRMRTESHRRASGARKPA